MPPVAVIIVKMRKLSFNALVFDK